MKIKLELGQVSCRLSRKEAQALAADGAISETVTLPGGAGYSVAIGTAEGLPAPQFSFDQRRRVSFFTSPPRMQDCWPGSR